MSDAVLQLDRGDPEVGQVCAFSSVLHSLSVLGVFPVRLRQNRRNHGGGV